MPAALQTTTRDSSFASTRWTVVHQAADSQTASQHALSALSELCQIYWRPVYVFLRRQGIGQHDAQDLTQGFFADLIESRTYARADPMKGRFRSFLLGTLKHFVAHARDRDHAQKRGGASVPVQLDEAAISEAETYASRCNHWSADGVFEREWAASLARQALDRLAQEYELRGKGALFHVSSLSIVRNGTLERNSIGLNRPLVYRHGRAWPTVPLSKNRLWITTLPEPQIPSARPCAGYPRLSCYS